MNRTRGTNPPPENLFGDTLTRTRGGMIASTDKVVTDVEKYMFPALRACGYGARWVQGKGVDEKLQLKEYEAWSKINMRLLFGGSGLLVEIYPLDNPRYIIPVQPFVRTSAQPSDIQNLPRFNIPHDLTEDLSTRPAGIHVKLVWNMFYTLDLHFLIVTETGQFWLGKFTDIPEESYQMSWRSKKERPDRIITKASFQKAQFHSIKKDLKGQLQTRMYYFYKNNEYARRERTIIESTGNSQTRTRQ